MGAKKTGTVHSRQIDPFIYSFVIAMRSNQLKLSTFSQREVNNWLVERRLVKHVGTIRKTGAELVSTSRRTLINLIGVMDGIRLCNLIQNWHRKEMELAQQKQKLHMIAFNAIVDKSSEPSCIRGRVGSTCNRLRDSESEDEPDDQERSELDQPKLTMGQVRKVLSSATGCQADGVSRVLINKRLKNGSVIKVALTDEFLSKFTLDPTCDHNSFLSINQVY